MKNIIILKMIKKLKQIRIIFKKEMMVNIIKNIMKKKRMIMNFIINMINEDQGKLREMEMKIKNMIRRRKQRIDIVRII